MLRARRVGPVALPFALILALLAASLAYAAARRPDAPSASTGPAIQPLAAVAWPVSTLVVSEVQTGGTSASDEFAELYNAGSQGVDLGGLELVYATSTGSTVTRKATWTSPTILGSGRHLLIANSLGLHAAIADSTYSGGFAATGGAVVLRVLGGSPIDAVGWVMRRTPSSRAPWRGHRPLARASSACRAARSATARTRTPIRPISWLRFRVLRT
jgi:hypothetical protein